jgi:hypothetical protein
MRAIVHDRYGPPESYVEMGQKTGNVVLTVIGATP